MPSVVPLREDDLCASGALMKRGSLRARAFVGVGRPLAQQVRAAMDVGVVVAVVVVHRVEHGLRLLAGVAALSR